MAHLTFRRRPPARGSSSAEDGRGGPYPQAGKAQDTVTPFDDEVHIPKLVLRYAVTGLVTLMVVSVVLAFASRRVGTEEAIRDANRYAILVASAAVEPVLEDGILEGDPEALAALDALVRSEILQDPLVRVKLWSRDGTILYSDESRLIGDQFTLGDDELDALDRGNSRAELSDLDEPENRFEEPAQQLLEVYLPVRTPNGTAVLFEGYFRYEGVVEQGRRIWLNFATFSLGALLLLELLQVPLAVSLAQRLRRSQRQRENLLRQAIESTDQERRRIARDLHDGVVQDLAGVAFSLGAAARRVGDGSPESTLVVRESAERVRDAVRSLRSLLVEIYPPNLHEEGVEAAISDLLARLEPRGVRSTLTVDPEVRDVDVETTRLLYRTAQEGLRNVVAHAKATQVDVSLTVDVRSVVLEIKDDGRGIPDGEVPDREGHFGLKTLTEWANARGAMLTCVSASGQGLTLRLEVPRR